MPPKPTRFSDVYLWCVVLLFGFPTLCGCIFTVVTWRSAQHNVEIWRGEFQYALDQQCPANTTDIVGGEGRVYLDANKLDYQWVWDDLSCTSNGRLTQCSCRLDETQYTDVTGSGQ